ncbi:isoprenyl transferase [Brevibacterium sp. 5221]|uniref:Isoprenyl transferase n=1 Tax=Brevibacterium rongguiense TaxID=2695267 RepID=A0A6N9H6R1_9MICO|nr:MULTISPECIES: isoprenyl transferase [Brevibacterium]MYM19649.1 isoprenyl transferase [Brevibacterium rongguiense]WAL40367.1 isoprenyl transferase [Brevibacterium sp. BRM-1]
MAGSALSWLYRLYDKRIANELIPDERVPKHIGVITDGNRRWAKEFGTTTENGHRAGADKIVEFLGWCGEVGVEVVTLYVLSRENLARSAAEVEVLTEIIADMVDTIADTAGYCVNLVGELGLLPEPLRLRLVSAEQRSGAAPGDRVRVNVAVGYGGRQEIVDALRSWLRATRDSGADVDAAIEGLDEEQISAHLYTKGQPDPDLIIRTSGEQRLSGFMMWQSAYSEFYFCEAYWPDFRKTDFLRALRNFSQRSRRFGR